MTSYPVHEKYGKKKEQTGEWPWESERKSGVCFAEGESNLNIRSSSTLFTQWSSTSALWPQQVPFVTLQRLYHTCPLSLFALGSLLGACCAAQGPFLAALQTVAWEHSLPVSGWGAGVYTLSGSEGVCLNVRIKGRGFAFLYFFMNCKKINEHKTTSAKIGRI